MKRNILSPADTAWLTQTIARNQARFSGFKMMADDESGAGAEAGASDSGDQSGSTNSEGDAKGFPSGTPVAEMTTEQRAAYWEHQSKKHEGRNKDLLGITGGKYGDDLKSLLDAAEKARQDSLTDAQRQLEDAKKAAREEAAREFGPRNVRAAFDLLLGDMPEQDRNDEIDLLDLGKFLTENGDVDTAKVRAFAKKIAPTDKDQGNQRHDFGAGRRNSGGSKTGVGAGADMFAASRNKSTTNNS